MVEYTINNELSLFRKFKFYAHRLCMDIIVFFRLNNWTFWGSKAVNDIFMVTNVEKEITILEQIEEIINDNIEIYDDDYDLTNKDLGYHGYFREIYHMEKLRILKKQAKMIEILIKVLG